MINRIEPIGPPEAYKSYTLSAPKSTHHRPATCAEIGCPAHERGWRTTIDVSTDLGARQTKYIMSDGTRYWTKTETGSIVTFEFPSGQTCFTAHTVPLEREPIYLIRNGDWRAMRGGRTVEPTEWIDDFSANQEAVKKRIEG